MHGAVRVGVAIAVLLATAGSRAQTPARPHASQPSSGGNPIVPCDHLPPEAVTSIPAPFDRYMRFFCTLRLGQGLAPVQGFHWADPSGNGLGLSATSAAGAPAANGHRSFPFSWYTKLVAVALSPADQQTLRTDLKQKAPTRPRFLDDATIDGATILELKATTSNAEDKRILLIVPDAKPGLPKWLAGFECNGACFEQDTQPLPFSGRPN